MAFILALSLPDRNVYTALAADTKDVATASPTDTCFETDTGDLYEFNGAAWRKIGTTTSSGEAAGLMVLGELLAGEENETAKFDSQQRVTEDWKYIVVDLSVNQTIIYSGECRIGKIYVNTVLSAHAVQISDGTTSVFNLIASLAAGSIVDMSGTRFATSLIIDPDASSTGSITVQYREAKFTE